MLGTRYEEYEQLVKGLPFVLHVGLKRDRLRRSASSNWHENLEIQLCTNGSGTVLVDSKHHPCRRGDMIVVNSNSLHYTGSDTEITYSCLIVNTDFCRQIGIDPTALRFETLIHSELPIRLFEELTDLYLATDTPYRTAKLHALLIRLLTELAERHASQGGAGGGSQQFELVKGVLSFIREHYAERITIDAIARALLCDKYALCRAFKRLTGQTIVENLNGYRCAKAMEYLSAGFSVSVTASLCGFSHLSLFAKTFKRYTGKLPKECKYRR